MLNAEKNRMLTQVGAGTPMGNVLRRYWHPIAGVEDLERDPIRAMRLFGENLVLYKDLSGHYGLIDRHCAHRRADMSYGFVERNGIRCNYHGWQFDAQGACVSAPYEDQREPGVLRQGIRIRAYPVRPLGGLLWAYMGPAPAPELPDWENFHWENGFAQCVFSEIPCNWLQTQENSIDPVHFEWMHANWTLRQRGELGPYAPTHLQVAFDEFEYGFQYKRITADTDENNPLWKTGRVCLWPNGFYLGDHFEWRVPIDDENTLNVTWAWVRVPREREPYVQKTIPSWHSPIKDANGRWITNYIINQDIVGWVGQGVIADRSLENLGASDRGIAMVRRQLFADIDTVAAGGDPKGIIRDPAKNRQIALPIALRDFYRDGLPLADYLRHPRWGRFLQRFNFHAGQPDEVRAAFEEAMGVKMPESDNVLLPG